MKAYLITGDEKTLEDIKRNCRILESRGKVKFTPTSLIPVDEVIEDILEEPAADTKEMEEPDTKEMLPEDSKDIEPFDSKEEPAADTKEAKKPKK